MARPTNANAVETRQRIIDAASNLFSEKGRDGTSVREIAGMAKVNGAMISHYFGGKEGLYQDCIQALYAEISAGQTAFETALAGGGSLTEIVVRTVEAAFLFAREKRGLIRLIMRHVLDRGELDPDRRALVLLPFLETASQLLAPVSAKTPQELRISLQSLIFLTVRYALCTEEELALISGQSENPEQGITSHLITTSMSILGLEGTTP